MKILILAILLIASPAFASPFLVCDPSAQAIGLNYEVRKGEQVIYSGPNEPNGSFKADLKDIPAGTHTVTARYVRTDMWGTTYGESTHPFEFTRPGAVSAPIKGVRLAP